MATRATTVHTEFADSAAAGRALADSIRAEFKGERPDAVIVFISPKHDYAAVLRGLNEGISPRALVGASSSGEFTSSVNGEGLACAVAIQSSDIRFEAVAANRLAGAAVETARKIAAGFQGPRQPLLPHRAALVLVDSLAGQMESFVEELNVHTGGLYRFAGGGAGGDGAFANRAVFCGTEVIPDGVVALEMLSTKPIGVGAANGWKPATPAMRVTEAHGTTLGSLDATAACEVVESFASKTGQSFDRADPLPFFLHNVIGQAQGEGYKLRVPLAVQPDGGLSCATEVPLGAQVQLMNISEADVAASAARSTQQALAQLQGQRPAVALFFDCVATRLRMGNRFEVELDAVRNTLGDVPMAGCNSIGQVVRTDGQFSGFHNCTAVACILPA